MRVTTIMDVWLKASCIALAVASRPAFTQELENNSAGGAEPVYSTPSVLMPSGQLVVEPSFQYVHSTATEVAIEGFAVVPSVAIGLINVSQVQRDSVSTALRMRYGLGGRAEFDLRVPLVLKQEGVRERKVLEESRADIIRGSSGSGLGDLEFGIHYQLPTPARWPFLVTNLRIKTSTGEGPFDVSRRTLYDSEGTALGEIVREQPTGSGFNAAEPSLSIIIPSDPAVLFGSVKYFWHQARRINDTYGRVDPGDAFGFSFGMGFSINTRASFSLGYDHSIVSKTEFENDVGVTPTFDRLQVGTLLVSGTYRMVRGRSVSVNLGVGMTSSAPEAQLSLRFPMVFGKQ